MSVHAGNKSMLGMNFSNLAKLSRLPRSSGRNQELAKIVYFQERTMTQSYFRSPHGFRKMKHL